MSLVIDVSAQTHDWVAFADHNGHAEMRATTLVELYRTALNSDHGTASLRGGRDFDRDTLRGVVDVLVSLFPCSNPHHHGVDLPGLSALDECENCESARAAMEAEVAS